MLRVSQDRGSDGQLQEFQDTLFESVTIIELKVHNYREYFHRDLLIQD